MHLGKGLLVLVASEENFLVIVGKLFGRPVKSIGLLVVTISENRGGDRDAIHHRGHPGVFLALRRKRHRCQLGLT